MSIAFFDRVHWLDRTRHTLLIPDESFTHPLPQASTATPAINTDHNVSALFVAESAVHVAAQVGSGTA